MRKFRAVFKEKQALTEQAQEKEILASFEKVYNALLEKYRISNFKNLNEEHQPIFLAELNSYWDEKEGILPKGQKFLAGNSDMLNEQSSAEQKKNFMLKRAIPAINETLRQSKLKYKLYDILDEMIHSVNGKNPGDVLAPKELTEILVESFRESVKEFMTEVRYELSANSEPINEREFSEKERQELAKKGYAMEDGGFPIVTKQDLKNAVRAFGRGDEPEKEKAHIIKRAKALGAMDLIPEKWKGSKKKAKVDEALGFLQKNRIKLSGGHDTPEAHAVAQKLIEWAKEVGIKAVVDEDGYLRDSDRNVLAGITPLGYVDVAGFGNWMPDELDYEKEDIVAGILAHHESPFSY